MSAAFTSNLPTVLVLVASGWWLFGVTRSWAGWDAPAVTVGALLIAVAALAVRPDRVLPPLATGLVTALSVGAFVVPLAAPSGWAGSPSAARYVCAAWLCAVVAAAIKRRPETRLWVVTLVVASVAVEFGSGWLGWWGGRDPTAPMVGTFYWHNPYAAFLLPGGLLGLAFWTWQRRVFSLLGIVCFSLASIGIVYSTSRAALAVFLLGGVALAVMAALDVERRRSLRQVLLAAVIAGAATFFVGGPPFFAHRAAPLAGEQARAAGQSLGQNSGYRLDFWREALIVLRHHPITGGGYKSIVAESVGHVPAGWPLSPYAHNGYLQALSTGGLILGLPFLVAVIAIAVLSVRFLVRSLRRRQPSLSRYAVPVALGCALLHSGVDFDWVYPANLAMVGILAGVVLGRFAGEHPERTGTRVGRNSRVALAGCLVVGLSLLGLSSYVMRHGDHRPSLSTASRRADLPIGAATAAHPMVKAP